MHNSEEWIIKKIGECLTIRHGRNQKDVEVAGGRYPILGTGGEIGKTNKALYDKPSVLIGRKGTIDKPRYMDTPFWTVDTLFYSEVRSENSAKFMYYVFKTINWKKYSEASGVPSLSASSISNIAVKLPFISEQDRIVKVLETWDEYIDTLEKKIELKERLSLVVMKQLVSAKRRLPGYVNDWQDTQLGKIANISMGQSPESSKYNSDGNGEVLIQGNADMKNGHTISRIWTTQITKTAPKGSLIMTVRAPAGEIAIASSGVCIGRGVCSIESRYENFLFHFLTEHKPRWVRYIQGSTFESINGSDIRSLDISIPEESESEAISQVLDTMQDEIKLLKKRKSLVVDQKRYMLNGLISGNIRIPKTFQLKGAK